MGSLVVDALTESIKEEVSMCMLFGDDITLVAKSREEINADLEIWRNTLESKGFCLCRSKTKYMHCNFVNKQLIDNLYVKLGDQIIHQVTNFKYLGSIIQQDD